MFLLLCCLCRRCFLGWLVSRRLTRRATSVMSFGRLVVLSFTCYDFGSHNYLSGNLDKEKRRKNMRKEASTYIALRVEALFPIGVVKPQGALKIFGYLIRGLTRVLPSFGATKHIVIKLEAYADIFLVFGYDRCSCSLRVKSV